MLKHETCFTVHQLDGFTKQVAVIYDDLRKDGWTLQYEKMMPMNNNIVIAARWTRLIMQPPTKETTDG
jgi:hypothetical protein